MGPSQQAISFKARLDKFLENEFEPHEPYGFHHLIEKYIDASTWRHSRHRCREFLTGILRYEKSHGLSPNEKIWIYKLMAKCYLFQATFYHESSYTKQMERLTTKVHKAARKLEKGWVKEHKHDPPATREVHDGIGESGSAHTNMPKGWYGFKGQMDSLKEAEFLLGEMVRRIGKEVPRERFQVVEEGKGGVQYLWTMRMTDGWLEATD
ncbi:MAG: hypothetical protein Q9170_002933 [Blastenia crenularia]